MLLLGTKQKKGDELDDDEIDFTFASGALAALPIVSPEQGAALPIGSRPVQALSPLEWAQVHEALESADEPSAKRFAAQSAVQALSQEAVNIATAEAAAGSAASAPGSPEARGAAAVVKQEPGSAVKRLMGKALWVPDI